MGEAREYLFLVDRGDTSDPEDSGDQVRGRGRVPDQEISEENLVALAEGAAEEASEVSVAEGAAEEALANGERSMLKNISLGDNKFDKTPFKNIRIIL